MANEEIKDAVSLLLIDKATGKILSASRRFKPDNKNLPGGKVDLGETFEEAAIRECFEETGLKITNLKLFFEALCPGGSDGISYYTHTYTADFDIGAPLLAEANTVVGWITWKELLNPANSFAWYNHKLFEHWIDTEKLQRWTTKDEQHETN